MLGAKNDQSVSVPWSERRLWRRVVMGIVVATMAAVVMTGQAIYNGQASRDDIPVAIAVDYDQKVIVTGTAATFTGSRFATGKFDGDGNGIAPWPEVQPDFKGSPVAMVVDDYVFRGNVYVTGYTKSDYGYYNYATVAYDEDGEELWADEYRGLFDDLATSITLDLSGNVVVTGVSYGRDRGSSDIVTIWYDPTTGVRLHERRYDSALTDEAIAVGVSFDNYVYVAGISGGDRPGLPGDLKLIKYNSRGEQVWAVSWVEAFPVRVVAMRIRSSTEIYVIGKSDIPNTGSVMMTWKFDASGAHIWTSTYDRDQLPWGSDSPTGLSVDSRGNVYVVGTSNDQRDSTKDIVVVKYSPGGFEQRTWIHGPRTTWNLQPSVAIDRMDNVYVAGTTSDPISNKDPDYLLLKLDPLLNSKFLWTRTFNSEGVDADEAKAIATDANGNIYVTGASQNGNQGRNYVTVKWDSQGVRQW